MGERRDILFLFKDYGKNFQLYGWDHDSDQKLAWIEFNEISHTRFWVQNLVEFVNGENRLNRLKMAADTSISRTTQLKRRIF